MPLLFRPLRLLGMRRLRAMLTAASLALVFSAGHAQSAASRSLVVLDPAHGGPDFGARLGDQSVEKDVTLALASRLHQALSAAGFAVVATRDADVPAALTTDARAEVANRQRAIACLVLHASATGSGVHLAISNLQPPPASITDPDDRPAFQPTPWDEAQVSYVRASLHLQTELYNALHGAGLGVLRERAPLRPLDNLTCPAVAVEIAPLGDPGSDRTAVTDAGYQQRVVDAIVAALGRWRSSPDVVAAPRVSAPAQAPAESGGTQ